MTKRLAYTIGMLLSLACAVGVYYWELRYISSLGEPGANELLNGGALIIVFTWPVWLSFPILSLIFRKSLERGRVVLSWVPALAIISPTIIRSVVHAI
jgi:hypothetical protein